MCNVPHWFNPILHCFSPGEKLASTALMEKNINVLKQNLCLYDTMEESIPSFAAMVFTLFVKDDRPIIECESRHSSIPCGLSQCMHTYIQL